VQRQSRENNQRINPMNHLTDEQLAGVALGTVADEQSAGHVVECDTCRVRLETLGRVKLELAAAHAEFEASHVASRDRLRAALSREPQPVRPRSASRPVAALLGGYNLRQRIALGGIGLSTAAVIVFMLLFANPARELSAMERIVKAVREVTSFSFQWTNRVSYSPSVQKTDKPSVIEQTCTVYWRAPGPGKEQWFGDLAAPMKSVGLTSDSSGQPKQELRIDITEVYPTGKPGILIDYLRKYYFRTPPLPASEASKVSPVAMLTKVREGSCEVIRELGTRQFRGQEARGYLLNVKDAPAFRDVDAVEVWVNSATNLPIEFSIENGIEGEYRETFRISDCRWNIELADKLFDTTPPQGFTDATWPRDETDIGNIVAALRLYANLSGGKYPDLSKFDRDAIRRQMLENAGFTGTPRKEWRDDPKYQQIDEAMPAFQRLANILLAKFHTGYYGDKVSSTDRDKVLFWWPARPGRGYVVLYGDLHAERVKPSKLAELEPATKNLVVLDDE
jgi:hypothetical protein